MNKKKRFEDLRDLVKSGRVTKQQHGKQYIEDTDGKNVPLTDPDVLAVIERRIAALP